MFRFITKHFSVNYEKLVKMNEVIDLYKTDRDRRGRVAVSSKASQLLGSPDGAQPQYLKSQVSDFSWMTYLDKDFDKMYGEWQAAFSAAWVSSNPRITVITAASKASLLATRNDSKKSDAVKKMWDELQQIKYKYQDIASTNKAGFIARCKKRLNEISKIPGELEDSVMQRGTQQDENNRPMLSKSTKAAVYVAYLQEYGRTYERAQASGAENDLQRDVLRNVGLYRCVKFAVDSGVSIAKIVGGMVTLSTVKKLVTSAAGLINTAGGLLAGMTDVVSGKEADFRTLSARYGWDTEAGELKIRASKAVHRTLGLKYVEDMRFDVSQDLNPSLSSAARANLMDRDRALERQTPAEMANQAQRMIDQMEKDRHEVRHSLFWVGVFKRDLKELREELDNNDATDGRKVMMRELQMALTELASRESKEDNKSVLPSQLNSLGAEAKAEMEKACAELKPRIAEFEERLEKFEKLLVQANRELDRLLTGADTRRGITDTQFRLASTGVAHNMPQLLAQDAQSVKLKPVAARPVTVSADTSEQDMVSLLSERLAARRALIQGDDDDDDDF
jgi:hypothetical protein